MSRARPNFTADLIGDLRRRVIDHNKQHPYAPVKLGALRNAYSQGYSGSNPGAAALAKVNDHLAKAANFEDAAHPRDDDGKFADKGSAAAPKQVSVPLPASQDDHRSLADSNAGYNALQSAVIPETRGATTGRLLREAGSAALGLTLAVSLARGKSNGVAARLLRTKLGAAGGLAGAGAMLIGGHAVEAARDVAHKLPFLKEAPAQRLARWGAARVRVKAGAKLGGAVGEAVGMRGFKLASRGTRAFMEAAGASASTPGGASLRRKTAVVAVAAPIAAALNSTVQQTPIDPEQIGAAYDGYSVRTVLKMVMGDEIGTARDALVEELRKGMGADDLFKAVPRLSGLYSTAGRAVLSGAAAIAGGLAGAGAGHGAQVTAEHLGGKRGNPYHDGHGRFTSSSNAGGAGLLAGGIGGAVAAGLMTYAGLRTHNIGLLRTAARASQQAYDRRLAAIARPAGLGEAAKLLARRADLIDAAVAKNKTVLATKDSVERFGASSPIHFKSAIVNQANDKIAHTAAFLDDFKVKEKNGWARVGDIKASVPASRRDQVAADRVNRFVETATPAEFDTAIKDVKSDESRKTLRHFFDNRATWANGVDQQIEQHHANIAAAEQKVATANDALTTANAAHLDTKAVVDRSIDTDELKAAETAHAKTGKEVTKAAKAHATALDDLAKLKNGPPKIVSPVNGQPLPPPSSIEMGAPIEDAEDAAHRIESAKFDKGIAGIRSKQRQLVAERANRNLAALAVIGDRHGLPKDVRTRGAVVARLFREIKGHQARISSATQARDTAQSALDRLGRKASAADRAELRGKVADATNRVNEASDHLTIARARLAPLTTNFGRHLEDRAAGRTNNLLPNGLREDLIRDLGRAGDTMHGAVRDFFQRPSMQGLLNFASEKTAQAKGVGTDIAHQLFFERQSDGSFRPDWVKASINATLIPSAVAGAREVYDYAHGTVTGNPDAKFPHHLIEKEINPLTGAAYAALVVPHPREKGEKVVLYGERQDSFGGGKKQIYAGGRISQVKVQFQTGFQRSNSSSDAGEATGKVHNGDAFNLQPDAKTAIDASLQKLRGGGAIQYADTTPGGPRLAYRSPTDADGNSAASAFMEHMKRHYLNKGDLNQQQYWHALAAFSSRQASILTPKQAYEVLTNRKTDGAEGRYTNGVFGKVAGFGSTDPTVVTAALRGEATRVLALNPTGDQKAALQRAVQAVGIAKSLDKGELAKIHQTIAGQSQQGGQRQAGPSVKDKAAEPSPMPEGWSKEDLRNVTLGEGRSIAQQLKLYHKGAQEDVANVIDILARKVNETHGLSMGDSVKAVSSGIMSAAGSSHEARSNTSDELTSGYALDSPDLFAKIDEAARKRKAANGGLGKLADLGDIDDLMKAFGAFDGSKHPRVGSGQHGGGEFSSGSDGGGGAQPAASGGGTTTGALSPFHPVRAVPDLASNGGMIAAWTLAGHYMPTRAAASAFTSKAVSGAAEGAEGAAWGIAQKFLPPVAGIAAAGIRLGVQFGAGALASAGAEAAGGSAVRAAYNIAGAKAPTYADASQPIGRTLAQIGGQTIGGIAGAAAGSGVASLAGSAAGAWAGGAAGEKIYDWFSGYGQKSTSRVMQRYMQPSQPAASS